MKKLLAASVAGILVCASVFAQKVSLTNTFGANDDNTGNGDFLEFNRKVKDNGDLDDGFENEEAHVDNRLQLDFSSEKLDGRVRMETYGLKLNGKESTTRLRGFVRFSPFEQIGLAIGNEFFTKITTDAAYLGAADDTPKWGRMAENGFAVVALPVEGLKISGGIRGNTEYDNNDNYSLDFGAQYAAKDLVTFGATAKSVTNDDRTFGLFARINSIQNMMINLGFVYNANDTDFIPEETKYALTFSAGYEMKDAGFSIYADVVSGLSSKYIDKEYKTSDLKNDNGDKGIPFQAKLLANYALTEATTLSLAVTEGTVIGWDDAYTTTVYPYATFALPQNMGDLDMGVRMELTSDGLTKFSIPFSWKCKFINKK